MADQYKDLSHSAEEVDQSIDLIASHTADTVSHVTLLDRESWNAKADSADLASKADQTALTAEVQAREAADTALQTAIDGKATIAELLGVGTAIADNADMNGIKTIGRYSWGSAVAGTMANCPINTYQVLTDEPPDWASGYATKYFTRSLNHGVFSYDHIEGETAPTFEADTYYRISRTCGGTMTVENVQNATRIRQTVVPNDTLATSGTFYVRFFASSYSGMWSSWYVFQGTEVVQ